MLMIFGKKLVVIALILLFYISTAFAASFSVETQPINNKIVIDEFAKFKLIITNNLGQRDEYRIYNPDFPIWDIRTEPLVNPITLEINPKSKESTELIVDPLKIKDIGTYAVNVNIRSRLTNELISVPLKVSVLSTEPLIGGYVPTVVTSVGVPEEIDPRQDIPIKIVLNNQNIIDYPDLVIKLESNTITDTIRTQLGPKEEKTLELKTKINPLTGPHEDNLVVALFKGNRSIINPIVRKIKIIEYSEHELVSKEKKFLRTKSSYEFTSNNPRFEGNFRVETTLLGSIFSSTNPKAKTTKKEGKRYFVWGVELEGNRMNVTIVKNFIPLFVFIVLLVVLVISYYMFRSPLLIRKEASNIVNSEGGISEMTVLMHIRNRGQNKIKEIEITESVPSLVSVEREISIGSLQPTKILKHEKKGTIVKWTIDNLDVSEERVLSYRIKSRMSIFGGFSLPVAAAIFKHNNKTFTCISNKLNIDN